MEIPIPSSDPQFDHQSSDSVADQLTTLSLKPQIDPQIAGTDNNGGNNDDRVGDVDNDGGLIEIETLENEVDNNDEFPVRVEADDCSFYLRTGMCKFGRNCRFNHPPERKYQGSKVKSKGEGDGAEEGVNGKDESLGKEGLIDCKYFDRPGGCKFGRACKFNHSRKNSGALQLNFMGLPVRPGEKECSHYMRNGSCKFGANCRFNHPDPSSRGPDVVSGYSNGGSILSSNASKSAPTPWSPSAALNGSPSYVPLIYPPSQSVASQTELNAYQAPVYPPPARNMNLSVPQAYAMNGQSLGRNFYQHQRPQILVDEYPERPGQPECSYFVKTGNCKYRSACKFHHPKSVIAKSPATLSDLGLPLRPGESICSYYNRYGICKYGPACKYDHPVNYGHQLPTGVPPMNPIPFLGNTVITGQAMAAGS